MKINNSISPIANVFMQLNADNPQLNASETNIQLGVPTVRAADPGDNNTDITLTGIAGQGFKNTVTVSYTRLKLNEAAVSPGSELFILPGDDLADVKALVAASWELIESEFTVTGEVPASPGTSTTITVSTVANSFVYVENETPLTITISIDSIDLETAVAVKQLTGFTKAV